MNRIFTLICALIFLASTTWAQLLTTNPAFIKETDSNIEITADATKGNQGLLNYTPVTDVYVHIGVITNLSTSPSNWKYVPSFCVWGGTNAQAQATSLGSNKWKYTITGNLRTFFGITDPNEKILRIAVLFRSSGSSAKKLANTDGSDMYLPVYDAGLNVRIDQPFREPKYIMTPETINASAGTSIAVKGNASQAAKLRILFNGNPKDSVLNGTTVNTTINAVSGDNQIVLEGTTGTTVKYDTISFFINTPVNIAALPGGMKDGINYLQGDTSVTLVLYAPNKTRAAVIGDFNNWTQTASYQMNKTPDGLRYWITINGLTPGVEYAYQYLIDGSIRVADIYTEKVLDPWNDQYIPSSNYPALKPYPTGQTGIVGILQTNKPVYTWQVPNFTKPDKRNLMIYELLVRDFVATQNWQTLKDTLTYLKRLGVNAIELMPFNEFEGNNSWGYNPDFYFAPDKMYGTETALKQFIDACHANGIAVIMDIALNHAFGLSPTVQMYWDAANNKPASNNPWHNPDAKHPFNVGYDFNHEAPATKDLVSRVIRHWMVNYKIDGFRWDLSKGFTQTNSGSDVNYWSQYDASRVAIWKRIYDTMQAVSVNSYCILEHLGANNEESELASYGMLLWGKMTNEFNEATMGFVSNSNFQWGVHTQRGWTSPHLITYMESHDEERLMYKNVNFGNSFGTYNTQNPAVALKRMEMAAAFLSMMPGPKMIWQFGELGYDQSINRCPNGSINSSCRVDPKPILWSYQSDANRKALFDVYAKLFALRKHTPYLPTFVTNDISYDLGSAFKWLKVTTPSLRVCVIGNFDVIPVTGTVSFQTPGTWYSYLTGATFTATGSNQSITLQPGEYYVYVDRDANAALPLDLLSFTAQRNNQSVDVKWSTINEINVKHFEVERSFNNADFERIATVKAINNINVNNYLYEDKAAVVYEAQSKIYYRLKMVDADGKTSYSKVAVVNPFAKQDVMIYPNPVKDGNIYIRVPMNSSRNYNVQITDMSGRIVSAKSVSADANSIITMNVPNMHSGTYLITIIGNNITDKKTLIIVK